MKKSATPFYLTGGTALSRGYFGHRFSDDLDFFTNCNNNYSSWVESMFKKLETFQSTGFFSIDYDKVRKSKDFARFFLFKSAGSCRIDLKIDFVNDVAAHYGGFVEHKILGRLDSWRNILSNKLSAIFRYEAKDIADIRTISKSEKFHWRELIREAKSKEAGVDPVAIAKILQSFPPNLLPTIKWTIPPDPDEFCSDLTIIAKDILAGRANTLGPS